MYVCDDGILNSYHNSGHYLSSFYFEKLKLIFGGLHEKHAVQRGIWVPTQHLLWDQGKPRKTSSFYLKHN
jgi:hypothetical protein